MDTTTTYLGLRLAHPFIAGASPLGHQLDSLKRLEDAGCAAVVLPSLFEEQIARATEGRIGQIDPDEPSFAAALANFPDDDAYALGFEPYLEHVRRAKQTLSVPVIASLNGTTAQVWLKAGRLLEQAGADAIELNFYGIVTGSTVPAVVVERQLVAMVTNLKRILAIPVAVKLTPFFTSIANVAAQLDAARVDALVLFNRFYQPDIDIETMTMTTNVELSTNAELRLRLQWVALLHGRIRTALAVSGGVDTAEDGIKAILAGASAVQLVSALLRHGPAHIATMRQALDTWMARHEIDTLATVRGRVSLALTADLSSFERGSYIRSLQSWTAHS